MSIQDQIMRNVQLAQQKVIQKNTCWTPPDGQAFNTVSLTADLGVSDAGVGDILVNLPRPTKRLFLCSIGPTQAEQTFGLYLHFAPIGIAYSTTIPFTPSGTEPWIELKNSDTALTTFSEGTYIEFSEPVSQFYLDINNPALGGKITMTWGLADFFRVVYRPNSNVSG
jgi:hypothetical protein